MTAPAKVELLVADPQNDFMDVPGAALPVPGAAADMDRLAAFIDRVRGRLAGITVTLDSHHGVGIERPAWWMRQDGSAVPPFTEIDAAQVRAGVYAPRDPAALPRVLAYLDALEAGGRYRLMVWPVHCEIGTWGHNVHEAVRHAYNRWERETLKPVRKVLKGMNAWTEHYSALQAEVPDPQDPLSQTNRSLLEALQPADRIVIAGEAGSHCVRATTEHLAAQLGPRGAGRLVLLADCMSPVSGFQAEQQRFLAELAERGATVTTSDAYARRLLEG